MIIISNHFAARWASIVHFNMCYIALSCLAKFHLVANKRYMLMVLNQAKTFFIILTWREATPTRSNLRHLGATRKLSPRFTRFWHSKIENRREADVLLEGVRIDKVETLQVPSNYDPVLARKLGLHPCDMYLAKCISRTTFWGSDWRKLCVISMKWLNHNICYIPFL